MSVTIRPINENDFEAVAHLHHISFNSVLDEARTTLATSPRYDTLEHMIVAEKGGQVVGSAAIFPVKMWLSGVPLNVGAVTAVAVSPDHQREGIATEMMKTLTQRAVEANYALMMLYAAVPPLYQDLNFGTVGDAHAYRVARTNLIDYAAKEKVRPFDDGDLPYMRVMYKGQMTWYNGWFTRSNNWWGEIIKKWKNIVVFDNDEMIEGYLAYDLKEVDGKRILEVTELFASEGDAFCGLIGFLASQEEVDIVEYLAPPDTPFKHCLKLPQADEPRDRGWTFKDLASLTSGPMGRIVNLHATLTKRFYARHMQGEKIIQLTDPLIPGNEQPVSFRLVDGRAESHPAPEDKTPDIITDVGTLTQIICGYLPAIDALRLGRLKASEDTCSWLDKAIADSPLFIQPGDWF